MTGILFLRESAAVPITGLMTNSGRKDVPVMLLALQLKKNEKDYFPVICVRLSCMRVLILNHWRP